MVNAKTIHVKCRLIRMKFKYFGGVGALETLAFSADTKIFIYTLLT